MPQFISIPSSAAALALGLLAALPANSEISPDCRALFEGDRLSIIVPNGPGGGYDTYARAMAPVIAKTTGARVSVENLPGAGGLIASRRIIEAQPDEWVIMVQEAHDILYSIAEGELGPDAGEKLRMMSVFHAEPSVWVTRPGFDVLNPPGGKLVGGSSSANESGIYRLVAKALSLESQTISGYDGTSSMSLGVLGSEIDVISISLATALRTTKAGDLEVAFILSEGPDPIAPELPHLLGADGKLSARLFGKNELERAEAIRIAEIAAATGRVLRVVVVPTALPPDRTACLESVVNEVLLGEAFRVAAEAEGRAVSPMTSEASQAAISELKQAMKDAKVILKDTP